MKPILSHRKARQLLRFEGGSSGGRIARGAIFHLIAGPWREALGTGGRDNRGNYYLNWCWPGKFEITVGTITELVRLVALGPEQVTRAIMENLHQAMTQLGVGSAVVLGSCVRLRTAGGED